jgi:hypothetical protein
VFQTYVLNVSYIVMVIHICFKRMFQVFQAFQTYVASFHLDVAKVDLDVACVAMAIHACFKHIFRVSSVFIRIL